MRLPDLADVAYEADEWEKARDYARKALKMSADSRYSFHNGTAINWGNTVLGRLALSEGHVEKAKVHLLEAGTLRGPPLANPVWPTMQLAKELLDLGERKVVVEYLKLCTNFWQTPDRRAERWIDAIEHGGIPDFTRNLHS